MRRVRRAAKSGFDRAERLKGAGAALNFPARASDAARRSVFFAGAPFSAASAARKDKSRPQGIVTAGERSGIRAAVSSLHNICENERKKARTPADRVSAVRKAAPGRVFESVTKGAKSKSAVVSGESRVRGEKGVSAGQSLGAPRAKASLLRDASVRRSISERAHAPVLTQNAAARVYGAGGVSFDLARQGEKAAQTGGTGALKTRAELEALRESEVIRPSQSFSQTHISVEQHNENHIGADTDIDAVMDAWAEDFARRLYMSAEGVHR